MNTEQQIQRPQTPAEWGELAAERVGEWPSGQFTGGWWTIDAVDTVWTYQPAPAELLDKL